jgi:Raf kinase inhibitor-like YbhB/YbcL family protein
MSTFFLPFRMVSGTILATFACGKRIACKETPMMSLIAKFRMLRWALLGLCLLTLTGCAAPADDSKPGGPAMTVDLTSAAFKEGDSIPKQYTADGKDMSPPLHWTEPPPGTKSFALICEDPDAPRGTWTHWVLFNLSPDTRDLPEAVPAKETLNNGARQGNNDFKKIGYGGPAPPKGKLHRYLFKVFALDTMLELPTGATKETLIGAMKGHELAQGHLTGVYER